MSRSPVIVAGMHRSGTSLVASWLQAMGLAMGPELYPADANNRHGYYEDVEFLRFNRELLRRAVPEQDGHCHDWGWTKSEALDASLLDDRLGEAKGLIETRAKRCVRWGWKDPRTTLLLDFWDRAASAEARFVLVYRYPWDVADSMQRLGEKVFLDHPEYALPVWRFYNRHLLDFYRHHQERAVLVSTNALVRNPDGFTDLLRGKLGLELDDVPLERVFDPERFTTLEGTDPLIGLMSAISATEPSPKGEPVPSPKGEPASCITQLQELDRAADLSSAERWADPGCLAHEPDEPPAVTVVLPCFNHGQFLIEAVASVERCAAGCEIVIVDDGSTQPRTREILDALAKAGYRVLRQENQGLSAARNTGIERARGRYILPLDADNRLRPGYVEAAVAILDAEGEVGVVYSDRRDFGKRTGVVRLPDFDLVRLLTMNYIDACAVFRRSLWVELGGYDIAMKAWEDWAFWVAAAARGTRFHHLEMVGFDYRVRPGSLVHEADDETIRRELVARVVERNADLYARRRIDIVVAAGGKAQQVDWLEQRLGADRSVRPNQALQQRDEEIQRRGRQIVEQIDEIGNLGQRVREQIDTIADDSRKIIARDEEIVRRCEQIRQRDEEIVRRCEQIRQRNGIIHELNQTALERDRDHAWLEEKHEELKQTLVATQDGQEWLQEKRAESERAREASQRDARGLQEALERQDKELASVRQAAAQPDPETVALAEEVARHRHSITRLETALAAAHASRRELAGRVTEQQGVLDLIHSSTGWRLISLGRRIVGWILPAGSAPRRLAGRMARRLKGGR